MLYMCTCMGGTRSCALSFCHDVMHERRLLCTFNASWRISSVKKDCKQINCQSLHTNRHCESTSVVPLTQLNAACLAHFLLSWLAFWGFGRLELEHRFESGKHTYSKVHNAIHSSPTINEYPQQTPQNPQVLGTCPGYISSSKPALVLELDWCILITLKNFWKT